MTSAHTVLGHRQYQAKRAYASSRFEFHHEWRGIRRITKPIDPVSFRLCIVRFSFTPITVEKRYLATSSCEAISGWSQASGVKGLGRGIELFAIILAKQGNENSKPAQIQVASDL